MSRSTRYSRQQNNERPSLLTEETPKKTVLCRSFATFIRDSAAAINEPFFFLVSGDHKKSMFFHTMLNIRNCSALLFGCGLVSCRKMANGSIQIESSEERWKSFLNRYHLDGRGDGCSDATRGEFYFDSSASQDEGGVSDIGSAKSSRKNRKVIVALRIGKYQVAGETITATLAINDNANPPVFCPKMRTAQRRLFNSYLFLLIFLCQPLRKIKVQLQ